jgi:hypothetical protein
MCDSTESKKQVKEQFQSWGRGGGPGFHPSTKNKQKNLKNLKHRTQNPIFIR